MKEISHFDWTSIIESLNEKGFTKIEKVLSAETCNEISSLYDKPGIYRNVINMQRYRFGKGEYKYFSYPLPSIVQTLREHLYPTLVPIANAWMKQLNIPIVYPSKHSEFLNQCHAKNQIRPTPLILKYEEGGYNTLHQDLYGEVYFPFQVVIQLSKANVDFKGGEFTLIEQIPRAQSRAHVASLEQGDVLIFTTNFKPTKNIKGGYYRANMKHGVSEITSGHRFALGIIFHDAL